MTSKTFNKWNNRSGWLSFLIALITYSLTVAPTVSFWDCGEYIAASSNLGIAHPPGAPLFQMFGAFLSIFSFGNKESIALITNYSSVIASSFTILFLFWTISRLAQKLLSKNSKKLTKNDTLIILGSAFLGALTFTFSDTFWFNAVETEVYAMATLVMALLFWLALKWEANMDTKRGNKWLLLIAFVVGLSFGIHFMGLLTIPAIVLLYFFKKHQKITLKNFIFFNGIAIATLLIIFKLLLPKTLSLFSWIELTAVNTFNLPFNSGTIISSLLIISSFYFTLTYTRKKGFVWANTLTLCTLFIFIGFSSWILIPIRAHSHTTLNTNNPANARDLLSYYNLEQYGERPLFYGPQFTNSFAGLNPDNPYKDELPKYEKDYKLGKYVIVNNYKNANYNTHQDHNSFLPRMWSDRNTRQYLNFMNLKVTVKDTYKNKKEIRQLAAQFNQDVAQGNVDTESQEKFITKFNKYITVNKPTTKENLSFMFNYQLGYMYLRYLMWNFTGRQNDIQGEYNHNGEWISGFNFIDSFLLGVSQENLPQDQLNNKARNTYYFVPFILGIIGFIFLVKRDKKLFWTLLVFFVFTGLAIQIYTNIKPFEPRERDYVVVGSFYVFAIWIGFSFISIYQGFKNRFKTKKLAFVIPLSCLIITPILLANQNWDDHNRTGRQTALVMAKSYLDSCDENAILFTSGDIDTYPLWYLQEVEKYRTDVKVIVTTYLSTDWYIDQMKRKTFTSDPIPSQLTHNKYTWGSRDLVYFQERTEDSLDIKTFMNFISLDSDEVKVEMENGQKHNVFPTQNIRIPVNKEYVLKNGLVKAKYSDKIVSEIPLKINSQVLGKQQIIMLDILANNNWERPIYFSGLSNDSSDYIWLEDYLQFNGMTYQLVPIKTSVKENNYEKGFIDAESAYKNVIKWEWGGSNNETIYLDPITRRNSIRYRDSMGRITKQLIKDKKITQAENILDLSIEKMPIGKFQYYSLAIPYINQYYQIGKPEKAVATYKAITNLYKDHLQYYLSLSPSEQAKLVDNIWRDLINYRNCLEIAIQNNDFDLIREEIPFYLNQLDPLSDIIKNMNYAIGLNELIEGLYKVKSSKNARKLYLQEVEGLKNSLQQASKLSVEELHVYAEEIFIDINEYKQLLRILDQYESEAFFKKEKDFFDKSLDQLNSFFESLEE
ncbi:glycosyltransferase family 117 protein [Pseudofulvibacter geojedonensis]|uniref:DUF2723 domain-containing protein n=1 Tax=Pseudofulvibacter geojedonensis TaxID=1123758 RepID=A0ABW3I5P4_9FLAO